MKTHTKLLLLSLCLWVSQSNFAQDFDIDMQLRPRYEYRNGYKELMKDQEYPNSFISQRSRLNLGFSNEKIKTKLSLQNIRVWGDVSTSSISDKNGIALYEAWGSYEFAPNWTTKIGRQVLSYDNQRILGAIDWAQQGQSHDALLVSFIKEKDRLDLVAALNNNQDGLYESAYFTNYKSMHLAWYHHQFTGWELSLLALNNGFQYEETAQTLKTAYMQTLGGYAKWRQSRLFGEMALYFQTGETALINSKAKVATYYLGANLGYVFSNNLKVEAGYEYLSGKDQGDIDTDVKSFQPLFGTNHQFNGFMDYFYVGNHKNSVGLQDAYLKVVYDHNLWQLSLIPHFFFSTAQISDIVTSEKQDNYLGSELDFMVSYKLGSDIVFTGGYSQMFATSSLENLRGGHKGYQNNWAWMMLSFQPKLFGKKNQ